jgi:AhpD family alkylhydroperoxidase
MVRVERRIELDPTIRALVKLRASFINGCAFCVDMHWADARAHGESEVRLAQVGAWHESPFFTRRERAALALTDAVTHVGETHVPDDVWGDAASNFEEDELAHLVFQIGAINLWNRVVVSARTVPASYTSGS